MNKKKGKYIIVCKYHDGLFETDERRRFDARNSTFWYAMDNLYKLYPEANITIEKRIDNKMIGSLYETVIIHCDSKELQKMADDIRCQHYYIVPLKFYDPDFLEQHPDIVEKLLRNNLGNE